MPTNKFFRNSPRTITSEQYLVDSLIDESIKINGIDCYYILRDSLTELDQIWGEDPTAAFKRGYLLAMLLDNPEGSVDGGDLLSRFGLWTTDSSNFVVAHREFEKFVPNTLRQHPLEGDLIYVPTMNQTFEIKKVEEEQNFYTLGKADPYFYNLKAQTFQYSQEPFDTGIEELDNIESDNAYLTHVPLSSISGNFQRGEVVYQGTSVNTAIATAKVDRFFPSNSTIHIFYTKGTFEPSSTIHGNESGAVAIIGTFEPLKNVSRYDTNSNWAFENFANNIVVTTENNPFGGASTK